MNTGPATLAVYSLLSRHCVVEASRFLIEFKGEPGCTIDREMVLINRYWRDALSRRECDSMEARSYLVDGCVFEEWVSLFERGVVGLILRSRPGMTYSFDVSC